jgi:hypothetical protein
MVLIAVFMPGFLVLVVVWEETQVLLQAVLL